MSQPLRVCLISEGSYPFITGGVSAWIQDLIAGLPEIQFVLFTISPTANQPLRYTLPSNVVEHQDFVLTEPPPQEESSDLDYQKLFGKILAAHTSQESSGRPWMDFLSQLPEGQSFDRSLIHQTTSWAFLEAQNKAKNPIYPFSDYFWAWKGTHGMMFSVLSAQLPQADVYHSVSTGFAGLVALAAKVRRKKPFLLTEHGLYHKEREMEIRKANFVQGYQRDMWIKIYGKISELCYRGADLATSLFEENRRHQLSMGVAPERAVVVPNGIDLERFSSVTRHKREGFHVGLVGRIVPIKDIKTFLVTCKILSEQYPDARFWAIGPTDEDEAYYQECVKLSESLGLVGKLEFTGRQKVLDYYAFLDVMLLTSVREAQPLVILEAWCAGVPVVSTRVGNVAEMLDYDERFLAASKDAAGLAQGVVWIREHPKESAQILDAFQRKTFNFYDKRLVLENFRKLYDRLQKEPLWQE